MGFRKVTHAPLDYKACFTRSIILPGPTTPFLRLSIPFELSVLSTSDTNTKRDYINNRPTALTNIAQDDGS